MFRQAAFAAAALVVLAGPVAAADISDGNIKAREVVDGSYLSFEVENWPTDARGVILIIQGPNSANRKEEGDYRVEEFFGKSVPALDLAKYGKLVDGPYSYEIRGGTGKTVKKREVLNNGRGKDDVAVDFVPFVLAGKLVVISGRIVKFDPEAEKGSEDPTTGDDKVIDTDSGKTPVSEAGEPLIGSKVKDADEG